MCAVVFGSPLAACSSDAAGDKASGADDGFGQGAEPFADGGEKDGGAGDDAGPAVTTRIVRGRWLHAIPNAGLLRVCYDPDYVADDPSTPADEYDPGPELPKSLGIALSFASVTTYSDMMRRRTGALTFHGMPRPSEDAGAQLDDDQLECSSEAIEAVLPLPFMPRYLGLPTDGGLDAGEQPDAGTSGLADFSILPTLETNRPVTLLGSGAVLDRAGVEAYVAEARDEYLSEHPRAEAEAAAAGERARVELVAQRGPLFLIAEEPAVVPEQGAFALHVAHLMPDVPGADGKVGEVRVCITEGTVERPVLPVREAAGLRFRTRALLGGNFAAPPEYRVRFFSRAEFDAEDKGCATTSLPHLAQYEADKGTFKSGKSYTLALVGSAAPAALCSPKDIPPLVRAGCGGGDPSQIAAHALLLTDANAD
jgi:hypothetical protein